MVNVGEFDLYAQEMNTLVASQKFTSLYRNMPWGSVSSEHSELSWWPQEDWKQSAKWFVQNAAHSLPLEFLLKS